jgi:hypothetical protein
MSDDNKTRRLTKAKKNRAPPVLPLPCDPYDPRQMALPLHGPEPVQLPPPEQFTDHQAKEAA